MHDVDILRLIWSKDLSRNGRENTRNGCKKARNGREKKMCTTWSSCFDSHSRFWRPFLRMVRRRHGPKRKRSGLERVGHVVSACSLAVLPSHLWVHALAYSRFTSAPGAQVSGFFFTCSCYVRALCCDCGSFVLHFERILRMGDARLLMWCCVKPALQLKVVCLRYLGVEKTYVMLKWILQIYPVQSSAVRDATHVVRRVWSRSYLACCTCVSEWKKCLFEPMEKESGSLLWGATDLRTRFFFRPLNGHILKSGRKKVVPIYLYICVCIYIYIIYIYNTVFFKRYPAKVWKVLEMLSVATSKVWHLSKRPGGWPCGGPLYS